MAKTKKFQVINNRMQFRCAACGAKRNIPVPPNLRVKNMRCHKCDEATKCVLNRRVRPRELHCGKVTMTTNQGQDIVVHLHDISTSGIGLDIPIGAARARKLTPGHQVQFKCSWNPRLFNNGRFVVKNIKGQRIGVKRIELGYR